MPCPGSWEGNSELALLFALNRSSRASRFEFAGSGTKRLITGLDLACDHDRSKVQRELRHLGHVLCAQS
jgi:hypothetical protein